MRFRLNSSLGCGLKLILSTFKVFSWQTINRFANVMTDGVKQFALKSPFNLKMKKSGLVTILPIPITNLSFCMPDYAFDIFFFAKLCGDARCVVRHLAKIHSPTLFIKWSLLHVFINFLRMHSNFFSRHFVQQPWIRSKNWIQCDKRSNYVWIIKVSKNNAFHQLFFCFCTFIQITLI